MQVKLNHRATALSLLLAMILAAACDGNTPAQNETNGNNLMACGEPRPEICTFEYNPVCGLSGEQWKTYGNACSACADENVSGYRPGECGDGN